MNSTHSSPRISTRELIKQQLKTHADDKGTANGKLQNDRDQ